MALAVNYAPTAVQSVTLNVYVNGVLRPHRKVTWGGDTSGGLPDQVVSAGTGMRSRTGTIDWKTDPAAKDSPHPVRQVDGWPPRQGDHLVIEAVGAFGVARRFTGRLGATTGSLVDESLSSQFTDTLADRLSTPFSIEPRLSITGSHAYRVAWEAIEAAGLGLLMEARGEGDTILHSTPQGDTWATVGTVITTGEIQDDDPYGLVSWHSMSITPDMTVPRNGRGIMVVARVGTLGTASGVSVRMDNGQTFTLTVDVTTRMMTMRLDDAVIRQEPYVGAGIPILAFGLSGTLVRLWTSRTTKVDFFIDAMTAKPDHVRGTRLTAVHVRYVASLTEGASMMERVPEFPASMRRSVLATQRLPATRGFENATAREVLEQWSDASLSSFWMDEFGYLQLAARDRLKSRPVDRTVRINERVFAGSWSIGEDSVYSKVILKGQRGLVRGKLGPAAGEPNAQFRVTIHQDQTFRGYDTPDSTDIYVEAPPDMDWGPLDLTFQRVGDAAVGGELNGSWYGGITITPDDSGYWYQQTQTGYELRVRREGQRALQITETVPLLPPNGTFYPRFASLATNAHPPLRGTPLPIIRAMWATTWNTYVVISGNGPSHAPALEHDIGWWHSPADARKIADSLAAEVTSPMATFSDVTMLWDPRRQIGDVEEWIAVDSEGKDSWIAKVLVVGYRETWDGNVPSQTVSTRVISMTNAASGKTYTDMEAAYVDYNQVDANLATYQNVYDALPNRYMGA